MPQAVENISSVAELTERLHDLERRVAVLEGHQENPVPAPSGLPVPALDRPRPPATWRGFPPVETPSGVVPVLGKAVLGIAGAYLLRALAESSRVPKLPVLVIAILYACFWMVWAVRTQTASRFASGTYAVTSALILSPLLWESTVRFQVLSPAFAAVVLVVFVVLAMVLAWQRDLQLIPWVATLATVTTAIALIIATRELVPLTAALLAVALATEIAACLGHRLSLRAFPGLAADFAVWLLVYVMTSDPLPEGYHAVAPLTLTVLCLTLLGVYGGSIGIRSFVLRQRFTILEIGQGVLAFLLAFYGTLRVTSNAAAPALGSLCLLFSAACYWGALSRFSQDADARNRRVYATWAAALFLAGSVLLFSANLQIVFLCVAAIAAVFVYTGTRKLSLGMHASVYLAAAATVSPLPAYAVNALAGSVPPAPSWEIWLVGISAAICYAIGARVCEDQVKRRLLWVIPAVLVGFTAAALVVVVIAGAVASRMELAAAALSVIRTVVNCGLALSLGFLGSRWRRIELGWVAYTALAFGTLKLLFEDLRFGNATSMVVSLLFYGLILILLPRLTKRVQS
jgi:hypothetical protein